MSTRARTRWALSVLIAALSSNGCTGNGDKNTISASGTIEATNVTLSAKVGGQINRLTVDEGSAVREGDTLAFIDHANNDIELRQAQANAGAAEALYLLTLRGARREDLIQAEANYNNARGDLDRMEGLLKTNAATQKQVDDARNRYIAAEQTYEKLKRGSRSEEIDMARARRDQAAAQVDAVRKKISDSYVTSPVNGIVTQKLVEVGETVNPNSSVFVVTRMDKVTLRIYVNEQELPKIRLNQDARIFVDAWPDKPVGGRVVYISPQAEFTPKNVQTKEDRTKLVFAVKIEARNPEGILKPGLPADVTLSTE